jgi:hypothetical protein
VLLHRRELAAEAVDLLVLRARGVALLREQRLLEMGQRRAELLARRLGAALDLVAQLAHLPIGVGIDRRPAQRDPEKGDENEGEKSRNQPVGEHPQLSQRRLRAMPAAPRLARPTARRPALGEVEAELNDQR